MARQTHIEVEICNLLLSKFSPGEIVEKLSARLYDRQLSFAERRSIMSFAVNSGHYAKIFTHIPELLRAKIPVPFSFLLEILSRSKLKPGSQVTESIIKGARKQDQVPDLVLSRSYDRYLATIDGLRREVQKVREEERQAQRERLLAKIAFFRNEQLGDEEKRLLDLVHKMYPNDKEIQKMRVEFEERWARHVIAKNSSIETSTDLSFAPQTSRNDSALEPAFHEMQRLAAGRKDLAYEFAVALLMMERDEWALDLIRQAPLDMALDWLLAEALLRSRRYVECLDHLVHLESRYASDPETAFSTNYLRAQALWGLNQTGRAQELLQSIISIRPGYRSASSILKDWLGGISQ